jgi:hypothetical protein
MQPDVSEMIVFMRSPTWISPAVAQEVVAALPGSTTLSGQEQMKNPLLAGQHYFPKTRSDDFETIRSTTSNSARKSKIR